MKRIAFLSVLVVAGMVGCAPTETQNAAKEAKETWPLQLRSEVPVVHQVNSLTYLSVPIDPLVLDAALAMTIKKDLDAIAEEKCKSKPDQRRVDYFLCLQDMNFSSEKFGEYQHLFQIENRGGKETQIRILSVQAAKGRKLYPVEGKPTVFESTSFDKPQLYFLVGVQQNNTQPEQTYDYRLKYQKNFFDFKLKITKPSN